MAWAETGLGASFVVIGVVLFRMQDDKSDKMADEADRTYRHVRENLLDPILQKILASTIGRRRPADFFQTPEVVGRLEEYRRHLFEFIDASHAKNEAMVSLGLLCRVVLCSGVLTIAVAWLYELRVLPLAESALVAYAAVVIPALAVSAYLVSLYASQNRRFKSEMRRLRGGLA